MDGLAPAERLIVVGERLLGEHGVDGVSLIEIARQAGHANRSAVQYHFGSKADLIRAIFKERSRTIGQRRAEMMASLRSSGDITIKKLVEALIYPVSDETGPDGRHHYMRFAERILNSTLSDLAWENSVFANAEGVKEMLSKLTPHLSRRTFEIRFVLANQLLSSALATIDRNMMLSEKELAGNATLPATAEEIMAEAVDMAATIFVSPQGN